MKSFLLIGGYCGGNPGDEAILKSTVYDLERQFPGSHYFIWTDQKSFRVRFDRGLSHEYVYWRALEGAFQPGFFHKAAVKLYTDLFPFSKRAAKLFVRPNAEFSLAVRQCDKVLFTGGGYLSSDYRLVQMNYLLAFIQEMGKRVLLLGQTLGPFAKGAHQKMAKEIFLAAEKIVLREENSEIEVLDFRYKTLYGIDDAIGFDPPLTPEVRRALDAYLPPGNGSRPLAVGINLRRCRDSGSYYPACAQAIARFARGFSGKFRLIFIPMETCDACDDRREGREFRRHLSPAIECVLVDEDLPVEAKFHLIRSMDLFIGMRFHCLVFSLAAGIPSIGLYNDEYYFRKIAGVLESFGLGRNALSIDKAHRLDGLMRSSLEQRERLRRRILSRKDRLLLDRRRILDGIMGGVS